VSGAQTGT
jgi:hypothetical protein